MAYGVTYWSVMLNRRCFIFCSNISKCANFKRRTYTMC